jgi:hypothetical protein
MKISLPFMIHVWDQARVSFPRRAGKSTENGGVETEVQHDAFHLSLVRILDVLSLPNNNSFERLWSFQEQRFELRFVGERLVNILVRWAWHGEK